MGEIGFSRREFLHDLKWWEVRSILRGYNRRKRDLWSATRWQTYHIMEAFCGSKNLRENGINRPTDLIMFPWEKDPTPPVSKHDIDQLQAEMAAWNMQREEKSE